MYRIQANSLKPFFSAELFLKLDFVKNGLETYRFRV